MTKSKLTKKALFCSILTILLSTTMLIGTSFAWFTDTASTSVNTIKSGSLDVEIQDNDGNELSTLQWVKSDGSAIQDQANILWEPGCTYLLTPFKIVNTGKLALKYKIIVDCSDEDSKLLDVIEFTYKDEQGQTHSVDGEGKLSPDGATDFISVSAHMDESAGNDYQNKSLSGLSFKVYATQDTVEYDSYNNQYDDVDIWDGSVASTQELAAATNDDSKTVTIDSAKLLAGFAKAVNDGNSYDGYTINLTKHIELNNIPWTPIGNTKDKAFKGTFDGKGKTICGLYINSTEKVGLFGFITGGTVENLVIGNANVTTTAQTAGILAAELRGVTIENIKTSGSVTSKYFTGGIIGSLVGSSITSDTKITNCENNATVSTTEDGAGESATGGIVGYASTRYGNTLIENCINNGTIKQSGTFGPGVGGIAGYLTSEDDNASGKTLTIKNCKNTGNVSGTKASGIAGAVGWPSGDSHPTSTSLTATFIGCSNSGTITGTSTSADICEVKLNVCGGNASIHEININ